MSELDLDSPKNQKVWLAAIRHRKRLEKERRLKRVAIDLNLFADLLLPAKSTPDYRVTVDGLPEDAIFVSAGFAIQEYGVSFFYLHESFDTVPEGVVVPLMNVAISRHDVGEEETA